MEEKVEYVLQEVFTQENSTKYIKRLKSRLRKSLLVWNSFLQYRFYNFNLKENLFNFSFLLHVFIYIFFSQKKFSERFWATSTGETRRKWQIEWSYWPFKEKVFKGRIFFVVIYLRKHLTILFEYRLIKKYYKNCLV